MIAEARDQMTEVRGQKSEVSAAADHRSDQFDRKRNFENGKSSAHRRERRARRDFLNKKYRFL